jgi:hypothetical protein
MHVGGEGGKLQLPHKSELREREKKTYFVDTTIRNVLPFSRNQSVESAYD